MLQNIQIRTRWEYLLLFLIIAVPLFLYVANPVIVLWDESRNAVNALEMWQNGNYFVRHFNGSPDMWEVKPPLLIWLQLVSFKLFGVNEFAIRIPSIVATIALAYTLVISMHKIFNLKYVGYMAALVLISSNGIINRHIARTGDHDALLIYFAFSSLIMFYLFITQHQKNNWYLVCGFLFLLCATYTKSIVSFMYLPGIAVFVLYQKKLGAILTNYRFYIALLLYAACVAFYYVYRNSVNPGYIENVWQGELFPRYAATKSGIEFYITNFYHDRFVPWIYILPFSIVISLYKTPKHQRDFLLLLLITGTIFLFVIGNGSKNLWYDALLYPIFSIIIAFSFYRLYQHSSMWKKRYAQGIIIGVFVLLFVSSYSSIIVRLHTKNNNLQNLDIYGISYFLRDKNATNNVHTNYVIVYKGYHAQLLFYTKLYKLQGGSIQIKESLEHVPQNATILVSQPKIIKEIEQNYNATLLSEKYKAKEYILGSPKKLQ